MEIALQIVGWPNPFFIESFTKITKSSIYDTVPLILIDGYEYLPDGNKNYRILSINQWLLQSTWIPGDNGSLFIVDPDKTMGQVLSTQL